MLSQQKFTLYHKHFLTSAVVRSAFIALSIFLYTTWTPTAEAKNDITWGVTYTPSHAAYLGLDPKDTYQAIIHNLKAKHIKLHVNWNATEPNNDVFNFEDLDYYVRQANRNDVELILVIGMKTGRWPECHTPHWVHEVPSNNRDDEILEYVETIVERYERVKAITNWQIENEPFLKFGTCPDWYYGFGTSLVESEVALVNRLDPARKVIISEPGELSDWTKAAQITDIVGITMYRDNWKKTTETFGTNPYSFLAPKFYRTKAAHIKTKYNKRVINIELQAEPWTSKPILAASLSEQAQSMNHQMFKENIAFASEAGLGTYYFWGTEWWYWMKTTHHQPAIWNEAKSLMEKGQ